MIKIIQRKFDNVKGTHEKIIKDIMQFGISVLPETTHSKSTIGQEDKLITKEIIGYRFLLMSLDDAEEVLKSPVATVDENWAKQEFKDRIAVNQKNPGDATLYSKKWQKMLESNGKFSYTYGERWTKQLRKVINELKKHINTRQAILTTWDSNIDLERLGKRRIPCTVSSQFFIRDGYLDQIYYIRSNDAIWILPSDIYQMSMLQKYIAEKVNVQVGQLLYQIGSLHIYKKNADIIERKLGIKWE